GEEIFGHKKKIDDGTQYSLVRTKLIHDKTCCGGRQYSIVQNKHTHLFDIRNLPNECLNRSTRQQEMRPLSGPSGRSSKDSKRVNLGSAAQKAYQAVTLTHGDRSFGVGGYSIEECSGQTGNRLLHERSGCGISDVDVGRAIPRSGRSSSSCSCPCPLSCKSFDSGLRSMVSPLTLWNRWTKIRRKMVNVIMPSAARRDALTSFVMVSVRPPRRWLGLSSLISKLYLNYGH
ncbi:unnamed protein product, partial [Discosporangium mesarthrocarpum]